MKPVKPKTKIIAGLFILLILVACWLGFHSKQNDSNVKLTSISQLNSPEYRIGVPQGAAAMTAIEKAFPDATIVYYNSTEDGYLAVQKGMIDAFAYDKAMMTFAAANLKGVEVLDEVIDSIGIVVGISPKRPDLVDDINAFIAEIKADGTYDDMYDRWVNQASGVLPDIKPPAHPTMALKAGTSGGVVPMNYYDENLELTGFDVEFMKRLAVYLNADLEISALNFDGMIASLATGRTDLVVSNLNATEERREMIIMSDPIRSSDTVLMVKQGRFTMGNNQQITDISQLAGKKVGIVTGTVFDSVLAEHLPEAIPEYFNSLADEAAALQTGRISAILMDEPMARDLANNMADITYLKNNLTQESYAFAFNLHNPSLQKKFNQVLADLYAEGIIAEVDAKWFGKDESAKLLPDIKLTGENGTIVYGTDCSIGVPFDYVKDQKIVGYEVELMMRICDRLGYDLEMVDMSFAALIPALGTGSIDVAGNCISVTEERKQSVLFSDPIYTGGTVVAVASNSSVYPGEGSFLSSIKDSFTRNFITESRYKLLLKGLGVTLLISLLSAVFGTILGFVVCMMRRAESKWANIPARVFIRAIQGTPIIVFLMILYYIVFSSSGINGIVIAIIGFSINFAAYVSEMMRTGIEAVDQGQLEAAVALGFNRIQVFQKITFPQAARHFLPVFKGEFISMIKMTSVVGYIAIQDLTKMSDIIRSRTYEAFFPLITTALIYFMVATLLASLLTLIDINIDPKQRPKIVKEVTAE